jgi:DNA-binding transcriptional LysR family regulator
LHHIELGADPLALVVHREHPLARRKTVALSALSGCILLMRERGSMTRLLTEQMLADAQVQPLSSMEIASREALREAVIRQMGVSIFAANEVCEHPELRVLPFDGEVPQVREYLYCLKDRRDSRLIDTFLTACQRPA